MQMHEGEHAYTQEQADDVMGRVKAWFEDTYGEAIAEMVVGVRPPCDGEHVHWAMDSKVGTDDGQ